MFEITIPVLDEESTLEQNTLIALEYIKQEITPDIRIVIADNGSTDNTEKIARKLQSSFKEIEYLKLPRKGVGLALRTSWIRSNADIVGYMDLDLATELKHLKEVYQLLTNNHCDIVNGSRLLKESNVKGRTWVRSFTSRIFNRIVRILLRVKLTDGMCGFKFFKRSIATDLINTGIDLEGWFFSTEILVKALWVKKRVVEIPVVWKDDPKSKVKIAVLAKDYLFEIFRLRKEMTNYKFDNVKT